MSIEITDDIVDEMPVHTIYFDSIVQGFHIRRQFSNVKTYFLFYRIKQPYMTKTGIRKRWIQKTKKIGRYGTINSEYARNKAKEILKYIHSQNEQDYYFTGKYILCAQCVENNLRLKTYLKECKNLISDIRYAAKGLTEERQSEKSENKRAKNSK